MHGYDVIEAVDGEQAIARFIEKTKSEMLDSAAFIEDQAV
jgi:PII-like signaling protein